MTKAEQLKAEYMEYVGLTPAEAPKEKKDGYTPPDKAKGMIIYPDTWHFVKIMTDNQAGELFKSLLDTFVNGAIPDIEDAIVLATYNQCMDKIIENNQKYQKKCIQNHRNRKGNFDIDGQWDESLPSEI